MRGGNPTTWAVGVLLLAGAAACGGSAGSGSELDETGKRRAIAELYAEDRQSFETVAEVSAEALRDRLQRGDDLVLVDVREPEEQAVSTIPGAIPLDEFKSRADEFTGRLVVTYCTIGYRSGLAAKELEAQGWEVANLAGSLLAWTHVGGELVDAEGRPTQRLHVYGARWDLAADGYETEW